MISGRTFRLNRITAISKVLDLQSLGPTRLRFLPETLTLTAACVWLLNGLHARPDDGQASRELMNAALPVIEASEVVEGALAYRTSTNEENHEGVAYNPFGCVFFRRMMATDVPRLRIGGPTLTGRSFSFWFDNMTIEQVQAKYQKAGLIPAEIVAMTRHTNKHRNVLYVNTSGAREPDLFSLSAQGLELAPPIHDDGSDQEDPLDDDDDDEDTEAVTLDARVSTIWRQFIRDVKSKSPNPRGGVNASYLRLSANDRRSADETLFSDLHLQDLFTDFYYFPSTETQWKTCFGWLFPQPGQVSTTKGTQNYTSCAYYGSWMQLLEENQGNEEVIKSIRAEFWTRIWRWKWIPKAEMDRIWPTSVSKPAARKFIRYPVDDNRSPAPILLLKENSRPISEPGPSRQLTNTELVARAERERIEALREEEEEDSESD